MNKNQFYNLLKPLISIYDEIEKDMILDILERIDNYDGIKGTLKWYLDKLNELSCLKKTNTTIINKKKSEIKKTLKNMLKSATENSVNLDVLEKYNTFTNSNLSIKEICDNTSIANLITEALKSAVNITELINTKAIESATEEYKNILNTAYLETATGIYTYDQSIKRAVDKMAENGIMMANYDSGRKISIEAAVRRDVTTRVNQLVGDVELTTAQDIMQTNLVYVDQHLGARTRTKYMKNDYEAHDEWQGKVYMISGSNTKYPNLFEKTGYKKMLGLKGLNCYHDLRPFFEWEEIPEIIDIEESRKKREVLDQQREYERNIRELKRQKLIDKKMGYNDDYKHTNSKLSKLNKKYQEFLDNNGLNRNYSREYVVVDDKKIDINKPKFLISNDLGVKNSYNERMETLKAIDSVPSSVKNMISDTKIVVGGNGNSRYDRKNNIIYVRKDSTKDEIVHEIGHLVETKLNVLNDDKFNKIRSDLAENSKVKLTTKFETTRKTYIIVNDKLISDYQGFIYSDDAKEILDKNNTINYELLGEVFSEGFREYIINPNNLKKRFPELYNYIEEMDL